MTRQQIEDRRMLGRMIGYAGVQTTTQATEDGQARCRGCRELRPLGEFEVGRAHSRWNNGRDAVCQRFTHAYCSACTASLDSKRANLTKGQRRFLGHLWTRATVNCNRRGRMIPIFITKADVERLYVAQDGKCAISGVELGIEMGPADGRKRWRNASLDRIDSAGAYHLGNCHLVSVAVNVMKQDMPLEEFGYWCTQVVLNGLEDTTP